MQKGTVIHFGAASKDVPLFDIHEEITDDDLHRRRKSILDSMGDDVVYGVNVQSEKILMFSAYKAEVLLGFSDEEVSVETLGAREFAGKIRATLTETLGDNKMLKLERGGGVSAVFLSKSFAEKLEVNRINSELTKKFRLIEGVLSRAIDENRAVDIGVTETGIHVRIN